jgi:hypothetical protein
VKASKSRLELNSTERKISILRGLFNGRVDAYGLDGKVAIREPLTDSLIEQHLQGKKRIGIYFLSPENTVTWATFDLDKNKDSTSPEMELAKIKADTSKLIVKMIERDCYPYLENSKSNDYHVHFFLDSPLPARTVKIFMEKIAEEAGVRCEIFPKQEKLSSNNGLGNFINLPLHGGSVKEGRTLFLSIQNFEPYSDQFDFLEKAHRTKAENIERFVKESAHDQTKPLNASAQAEPETNSSAVLDVPKYLSHYEIEFTEKREPNRTIYRLKKCPFSDEHTTGDGLGHSSIIQGMDGKLTYHCFHSHCTGKKWADVRQAISGDNQISQFLPGGTDPQRQERNLVEDLRSWVENAFSKFTTEMIYRDLGVLTPKHKAHVRVGLHRLVEKGVIEKGNINGTFIKIASQSNEIRILNEVPTPLPLILPGGLHKKVSIYPKNLMVGAGSSNGGKTAYGLNCAYENRERFDTWYFTSEMDSDELTLRTNNFGYPIEEWYKVHFKPWESCHSIRPNAFNILDYLEVREGEFWRVGDDLRKIFEKLQKGIALVFIQMDRRKEFGWGGQKTVDKARLYFNLDDNKLKIVKAKNWTPNTDNPNGKSIIFKLHKGAIFEWGSWS